MGRGGWRRIGGLCEGGCEGGFVGVLNVWSDLHEESLFVSHLQMDGMNMWVGDGRDLRVGGCVHDRVFEFRALYMRFRRDGGC